MKSSVVLFVVALLTTEARHLPPKKSLTSSLPTRKHRASRAIVNESSLATSNDVRSVRGGGGGEATMTNEMFNMVKAVVGVGVLSLPAGELDAVC